MRYDPRTGRWVSFKGKRAPMWAKKKVVNETSVLDGLSSEAQDNLVNDVQIICSRLKRWPSYFPYPAQRERLKEEIKATLKKAGFSLLPALISMDGDNIEKSLESAFKDYKAPALLMRMYHAAMETFKTTEQETTNGKTE